MRKEKPKHRPGDLFLNRYMAGASRNEREEAYENLRALILVLIRIDDRLAREEAERDSRNLHEDDTIRELVD